MHLIEIQNERLFLLNYSDDLDFEHFFFVVILILFHLLHHHFHLFDHRVYLLIKLLLIVR